MVHPGLSSVFPDSSASSEHNLPTQTQDKDERKLK